MFRIRRALIIIFRQALRLLGDPLLLEDNAIEEEVPAESLRLGDVMIDFQSHQVNRGGKTIPLTRSEYEILITLASSHGELVDYASLVQSALGYEVDPAEAKELIKRHIFTLRQKIGPNFETPRYILNVRGYGYRLVSSDRAQF